MHAKKCPVMYKTIAKNTTCVAKTARRPCLHRSLQVTADARASAEGPSPAVIGNLKKYGDQAKAAYILFDKVSNKLHQEAVHEGQSMVAAVSYKTYAHAVAFKADKIISERNYFVDGDVAYSLLVLEGTEESVKAMVGEDMLVEEVFPTCLIEPVTEEAVTGVSAEEQQAQVTWGVEAVRAPHTNLTGAGVTVAVLDTGLDKAYQDHPAFKGIRVKAKNFTTKDEDDWHDRRGHGTHCLGTILGRKVDGVRIGVAPGVTDVLVAKVVPDSGKGNSDMLADGITWAWEEGAQVINISLAYDLPAKAAKLKSTKAVKTDEEVYDTVEQICLRHRGFFEGMLQQLQFGDVRNRPPPIIIAAAGNDRTASRKMHVQLPAALKGVVSVAAVKKSPQGLEPAAFSNKGASICAPGVLVWSAALSSVSASSTGSATWRCTATATATWRCTPNANAAATAASISSAASHLLRVDSGTSMAAPHVAGVAALWWQYARDVKHKRRGIADFVASKLCGLATDAGFVPGVDEELVGQGLVQAPEAVAP